MQTENLEKFADLAWRIGSSVQRIKEIEELLNYGISVHSTVTISVHGKDDGIELRQFFKYQQEPFNMVTSQFVEDYKQHLAKEAEYLKEWLESLPEYEFADTSESQNIGSGLSEDLS